jgi:hypothetical protein
MKLIVPIKEKVPIEVKVLTPLILEYKLRLNNPIGKLARFGGILSASIKGRSMLDLR